MGAAPREIELKLDCGAAEIEALSTHPLLAEAGAATRSELRSVYYDTPDRSLQRAGVALRVRSVDGANFRQTVKTAGDGMLERGEWEHPLEALEPSPDAIAETPARAIVADLSALAPAFTVLVERRVFLVEHEGAKIEVALDLGRIETPAKKKLTPFSEIELELKDGEAASLFSLARALMGDTPLPLGALGKSERGFRLVDGRASEPLRAEPVKLAPGATAASAFRAIAHGCIRQIRVNEDLLLQTPDVEALHQLRVGVRRLRSAMSLFSALLKDPQSRQIRDGLKQLTGPLGAARDLDVLLTETLVDERRRRPDEIGLLNLEKQLESDRTKAYGEALAMLRSPEWRRFLFDVLAWINAGDWLAPEVERARGNLHVDARHFAAATLDKRHRQIRKRGRRLDEISVEERHRVRIAAKKLRYGVEFFESLFEGKKKTKRRATFLKMLKALQKHLGALNDIATAQDLVSEAATTRTKGRSAIFAAGMTSADVDVRTGELLRASRKARKRLVKQRPFWR